jgi:MFS family permease
MSALDAVLDTRPLRGHPAFRRLWLGTAASTFGGQLAVVAVLYQVWELTRSPFWVGAIGLAEGLPMIAFGLLGGSLADRVDRRRLVLVTSSIAAVAATGLAVQAGVGLGSLAVVLGLVAAQSAASALGSSARRAMVTRLLPREQVPAGLALQNVTFSAAMLLGPAVAGLVLAGWGLTAAYALDAVAVAVSLLGVVGLPAMRPPRPEATRAPGWSLLLRRPAFRGALATDLAATVLAMPVALFPILNEHRFGGSPETLGLFLSAIAAGGILAGLASGPVTRATRPGLVALAAAAVWGLAMVGFGLVGGLLPTLAWLALAGAADTVAVLARGIVVQLDTPDSHLGRAGSAEYAVGAGGPAVGNARAGVVAGVVSAEVAAVTGGLACVVAVGAIAVGHPALRGWRASSSEE